METQVENRKKNNLLLILAIIAASLIVIWVITVFDRSDDPDPNRSEINVMKQTFAENQKYSFYDLLQIKKDYT